jgi:hypothetical protein
MGPLYLGANEKALVSKKYNRNIPKKANIAILDLRLDNSETCLLKFLLTRPKKEMNRNAKKHLKKAT